MASALALHLADFNHPHNPKTTASLNIADGTKVIESVLVDDYKTVIWLVSLTNGTVARTDMITAVHNGTSGADATALDITSSPVAAIGNSSPVTLSVALSGATTSQVMRLTAATSSNGWTVSVRRMKV